MLFILVLFILCGAFAYMMNNPHLLKNILTVFLLGVSFLTPFWPLVLVGIYLHQRLKNRNKN